MLMASAIISLISAFLLTFVVLHPRIQEGVIVKSGLILMIFSLFVTFALVVIERTTDPKGLIASAVVLRVGLVVTCVGVLIWASKRAKSHRQITGAQRTRATMNPLVWMAEDLIDAFKTENDKSRTE